MITQNLIQNLGGGGFGFGVGVILYNNFYAAVTDNVIDTVRMGVQTGNFYSANPVAAGTAEISDNQISAYRRGIFYNLSYSDASAFTVDGNVITAVNDPTAPGTAYWTGILISAQQSAVNATFTDNTIDGSGATSFTTTAGYTVWDTPTTGNVLISGGSVTGVGYGVWVNTYEGYNSPADVTQATISGVSINASQIGVYVEDSPLGSHPAVSATIENNTSITTGGDGTGIEVSGANASATITGNNIYDNTTGINVSSGSAGIAGNDVYGNTTTGILLDQPGAGTAFTANTVSGNGTGISLDGAGATGITINQNTVENSVGAGIYLTGDAGGATVSQNLLSNNAVGVWVNAAATNVGAIQGNSFMGNATAGLENDSAAAVDATGNWWGSINGPTTAALNTYAYDGITTGNAVIGNATVAPWLTDGTNYASPGAPGFVPGTLNPTYPSVPGAPTTAGNLSSDGTIVTNVTTPTFTGTANPGTTVALMEGTTVLGQTTAANVSGDWSIMVPNVDALSTGDHTFVARSTKQTGLAETSVTTTVLIATTPTFSDLSSPSILYGTATTTLSGDISASVVPTGTVAITLDGVKEDAPIGPTGTFSFVFDTSSFHVSHGAYGITYAYEPSGLNPLSAINGTGTLTVNKYAFSYTIGNDQQTYGTAATLAAVCPLRNLGPFFSFKW